MKKNKIDQISIIIVVIGILATFTIFLPTLAFPNDGTEFSGFNLVFGNEFINLGGWASGNIHLSFLGILAYLLPIVAALCVVFVKKGYVYAIGLFAISLVLLFMWPIHLKTTVSFINTTTEIDVSWTSLYGLVIAKVFVVVGVIVSSIKALKYS